MDVERARADGNAAFAAGDYARADALYSLALDLTADAELRGTLFSNRSAARLQLGAAAGARADAAEAVRLRPQWPKARARLVAALMALHRPGEAAEALRAAGECAGEEAGGELLKQLRATAESAAAWAAGLAPSGGAAAAAAGTPCFAPILQHSLARVEWLPPALRKSCRAGPWTLTGPISSERGSAFTESWGKGLERGFNELNYMCQQEDETDASGRPVDMMAKMMGMVGRPMPGADPDRSARALAHLQSALPRSAAATRRFVRIAVRACFIEPPIWRRVVAPASVSLHALADRILLTAFGLSRGLHTYAFHLPPAAYPGHRLPPFGDDISFSPRGAATIDRMHAHQLRGSATAIASQDVLACDLLREPGDQLRFTYDFGDKYVFAVELEDADAPAPPQGRLALLAGGARAGLPENPGSPLAHARRLRVFASSRQGGRAYREAFAAIAESAPNLDKIQPRRLIASGVFDAEHLDLVAVQQRLDEAMLEFGGRSYGSVYQGGGGAVVALHGGGESISRSDGVEAGRVGTHKCAFCAKAHAPPNFCAACREVTYCNADCQRAHWKSGHRLACVRRPK